MADQTPDAMMYVGVEAIPGDIEKILRQLQELPKALAKNPLQVKAKLDSPESLQATANVFMQKVVSQAVEAYSELRKIRVEANRAQDMVIGVIESGNSKILQAARQQGGQFAAVFESAALQGLVNGFARVDAKIAKEQASQMSAAGKKSASLGATQNKTYQAYEAQAMRLRAEDYQKYRQEFEGEKAGESAREMLEKHRKNQQKKDDQIFSRTGIRKLKSSMDYLFGDELFSEAKKAINDVTSKAEVRFGKDSAGYKQVQKHLRDAFGRIVESRMSVGDATTDAIARQKLESLGGPSGNRQSSDDIKKGLQKALDDQIVVQKKMQELIRGGNATAGQVAQEFQSRSNITQIQNDLKRIESLDSQYMKMVERLEKRGPGRADSWGSRVIRKNMEMNRAEVDLLSGGGNQRGKISAHGAQFAAMNAAYGFQDFFQVLAQPGMGPGRAFLAAANNIGPALGAIPGVGIKATVAIGGVMAAMSGFQYLMGKNDEKTRKHKESIDALSQSFKRMAANMAVVGRAMPLGSQTGLGGIIDSQNSILGRAPMGVAALRGMQARSSDAERAAAAGRMGFWGGAGGAFADFFSRVGTPQSPSRIRSQIWGKIPTVDEIGVFAGGKKWTDPEEHTFVDGGEVGGDFRETDARRRARKKYQADALERQRRREEMEENGDLKLLEDELLRNREAMDQLGQMRKYAGGIGARSRAGFSDALADSRKFGDKGIATGFIQNLYGEMQQSAMAAKRARQNLEFLENNTPESIRQLDARRRKLAGDKKTGDIGEIARLEKAGLGGEAATARGELEDIKNQLMAFDNEMKEAGEAVSVFSLIAKESESAFMSIANQYKGQIKKVGENGKATMIQSSDLWSRIQESLSGNDVEKQQLSVLEKILAAVSTQEKLNKVTLSGFEGNDSGGYAGGGKKPSRRDTIPALLRDGEVVLTPEHQARLAQRLKMSPADLFGGMGMRHAGSSLKAYANVGGFDGGGLVGGMRFSSMLDGGFRKWQKQQDAQRSYANRQWTDWEDEEPFRERYLGYKLQSARMRMSSFYRNQGVPLYGRGAGGHGGRTFSGPKVPTNAEAWPGGMPFISAPGTALNLPRSGRSAESFEEAMKQRTYRETMHQIRGVGATGHESSVSAANAMQLAEMKRRGMSQGSVDAMARTHAASAAAKKVAQDRAMETQEQKEGRLERQRVELRAKVNAKNAGPAFDKKQAYLDFRAQGISKEESQALADRQENEFKNPQGPVSSTTRGRTRTNSWMEGADAGDRSPFTGLSFEKEKRLKELTEEEAKNRKEYDVRGGDRGERWRKGGLQDMKDYSKAVVPFSQNVSGQEQAASGVGFGGNDRNTAVLERIAETLITSSRDSVKASEKVVSAIESSGISIS